MSKELTAEQAKVLRELLSARAMVDRAIVLARKFRSDYYWERPETGELRQRSTRLAVRFQIRALEIHYRAWTVFGNLELLDEAIDQAMKEPK